LLLVKVSGTLKHYPRFLPYVYSKKGAYHQWLAKQKNQNSILWVTNASVRSKRRKSTLKDEVAKKNTERPVDCPLF